jgi:hypothetical protein
MIFEKVNHCSYVGHVILMFVGDKELFAVYRSANIQRAPKTGHTKYTSLYNWQHKHRLFPGTLSIDVF